MKATLLTFWEDVRSSYWFIPSLMALAAVLLSSGAIYLDGVIGAGWMDEVAWLYANKPDGARALLSTISGSMITVAGVTFSITIASVAYATGQFGPRLLTNFMQDRGNQVTLGTFIATFLYCLLVLRTIRGADERTGGSAEVSGDFVGAFVPHAAILIALVLTLASVGVLIFFIHHVPDSIHISNVIAKIGRELNAKIDSLFPEMLGQKPPEELDGEPESDVRNISSARPPPSAPVVTATSSTWITRGFWRSPRRTTWSSASITGLATLWWRRWRWSMPGLPRAWTTRRKTRFFARSPGAGSARKRRTRCFWSTSWSRSLAARSRRASTTRSRP